MPSIAPFTFRSSSERGEGGARKAALLGRPTAWALGVGAVALALRLPLLQSLPGSWDAIDFALALDRYDLTAMQPHFPGYPVFIWLGVLVRGLLEPDPFRALALLSALAGAGAVGVTYLLGRALAGGGSPDPALSAHRAQSGHRAGLLAALWLAVSPLHWLVSGQPLSDSLGLLFALLFLLAAWVYRQAPAPGRAALAGLLLGLTLGVRLSYFPLAFTLLLLLLRPLRPVHLAAAVAGGVAGTLPWLLWQMIQEGPARLLRLALLFTQGHLGDWGGAVGSAHAAPNRFTQIFWEGLAGLGLGGPPAHAGADGALLPWAVPVGALVLALTLLGLWRGARRLDPWFMAAWLLPYLVWLYGGQNPENPRHLLPLLPAVIIAAAAGLAGGPETRSTQGARHPVRPAATALTLAGLALLAAALTAGLPLALEQARSVPPTVQLARHLKGETAPVFTWEEERTIRLYAPEVTVHRLRRLQDFERALLAAPDRPARVLATSAFLNGLGEAGREVRERFRPVARFKGHPLVYSRYHEIRLYEAGPDLYPALDRAAGPGR